MNFFKNIPSKDLNKILVSLDIDEVKGKYKLVKEIVKHLNEISVKDLKKMLAKNHIEVSGSKKKLVKIIRDNLPLKLKLVAKAMTLSEETRGKLANVDKKKLGAGFATLAALGFAYYNKDALKNLTADDLGKLVDKVIGQDKKEKLKQYIADLTHISKSKVNEVVAVIIVLKNKVKDFGKNVKDLIMAAWKGSTISAISAYNSLLSKLNFSLGERWDITKKLLEIKNKVNPIDKLMSIRAFVLELVEKIKEKIKTSPEFQTLKENKENLSRKVSNISSISSEYFTPKSSSGRGSFFNTSPYSL